MEIDDVEKMEERIIKLPKGRAIPWVLDVDGVLNADDRTPVPAYEGDWPRYRRVPVLTTSGLAFPFVYSVDLVNCVNLLVLCGQVQVHWLSTWGTDAPTWVAPALGLNVGSRMAGHQPFREREGWWKTAAIQKFSVENACRFFWTDDQIGDKLGTGVVHAMTDQNCLALSPDGRFGLSPDQLNLMLDVIQTWRGEDR